MRTSALLSMLIFGVSVVPMAGQSWEQLRGLNPGEKIRVLKDSGKEYSGEFKSLSDTSISLEAKKGEIAVDRPHVRRVQIRSNERRLRNTIIGTVIGVGIGVAIDQTLGQYLRNESGDSGRALTYIVPTALLGGLGAVVPAYKTIYRVR